MGLLPAMSDAMGASAQPESSIASDAADVHWPTLVHCRQCAAWVCLSSTRTLSSHRTSGGIVTYFRCTGGHADFYETSTVPRWSAHGHAAKTPIANALTGTEEREPTWTQSTTSGTL